MPYFSICSIPSRPKHWLSVVSLSTYQALIADRPILEETAAYTQRIRSRFDGGGRVGGGAVSAPPTAWRRAVCRRTLTFTLLASQLDVTETEVVYRGRPWPHGPIVWPPRTIRRPYWPKYHKNERHRALAGQNGSGNMAATRYFDSATKLPIRLPIPRTTTARRGAVKSCRTVTFTLLAHQLDMSAPEVVSSGRPWALGPIAWPSRTIRRRYWPKYCKNERQEAAVGQTGSGNMAATQYFDSATPTSYSTSYTFWGLSLTVTELVFENVNITPC